MNTGTDIHKSINWKDILNVDKYFKGLTTDSQKKEALDASLKDGDFSCVKKHRKDLIKPYMEQEKLPYPASYKINWHKNKRLTEKIYTSLYIGMLILLFSIVIYVLNDIEQVNAEEEESYIKRTELIADYMDADPYNLLITDQKSGLYNKFTGVSIVTYEGNKYHIEFENANNTWEIKKYVQLD